MRSRLGALKVRLEHEWLNKQQTVEGEQFYYILEGSEGMGIHFRQI